MLSAKEVRVESTHNMSASCQNRMKWTAGSHEMQGSYAVPGGAAHWDLVLNLSNWNQIEHTFDARVQCPRGEKCLMGQSTDGDVRKFYCDADRSHCELHFDKGIPGSNTGAYSSGLRQIYGSIDAPVADVYAQGSRHIVYLKQTR